MANTWQRIKDGIVRKAFQEIVELFQSGDRRATIIENRARSAEIVAYDALRAAAATQATLDGRIVSFFQPDAPTGDQNPAEGDLWFDTDDGNHVYRYTNGQWVDAQDSKIGEAIVAAQNAQATADGKIVTYYQDTQPTGQAVGDIWFDTSDDNKAYRWNGTAWIEVRDQKIIEALNSAQQAQATADGKIVTYYQDTQPTGQAVGDLWFDTSDNNHAYRWDGSQWVDVKDQQIIEAYNKAQTAQATADGKIVTYYSSTAPQGQAVGDLWFDTSDNNHAYRWDGSQWVDVKDQQIIEALNKAQQAQATADGKIVSYFQASPPTGQAVGDLWFDTDDGNRVYRWNGSAWIDAQDSKIAQAINDAALAQATADSKIVTYYQAEPPTGQAVGDLWVDTNDNNHLYRWNGSAWVSIRDQLVLDGYYNHQQLIQDLQAGVSLVFKDISTIDASVPSALVVGNITLNPDGTVAYGSRGVAITKNGLAGYDQNYNGSGDLPSFEIDTNGNATFRGQLGAAGGTFAGTLSAASGTFTELESGDISTNGIKLTATDISYYRSGTPFTAVKNVQTGFGNNGDIVNIAGFYDRAPEIMVSPRSLVVYNSSYSSYSQMLDVSASNLSGNASTGEWSFQLTAVLKVYDPIEHYNNLLFDSNGSQFTLGSNFYVYKKTTPTVDITDGIVKYVDFSSFFRFCTTDNRRMRVELYSYIEFIKTADGSTVESLQYVGEYEISSWGAVDANIATRHTGITESVKELRFGFAIKFLEDLGSAFDDNTAHCLGLESFTMSWTETGHSALCAHSDTNLSIVYDTAEIINPDGQLNWVAIG